MVSDTSHAPPSSNSAPTAPVARLFRRLAAPAAFGSLGRLLCRRRIAIVAAYFGVNEVELPPLPFHHRRRLRRGYPNVARGGFGPHRSIPCRRMTAWSRGQVLAEIGPITTATKWNKRQTRPCRGGAETSSRPGEAQGGPSVGVAKQTLAGTQIERHRREPEAHRRGAKPSTNRRRPSNLPKRTSRSPSRSTTAGRPSPPRTRRRCAEPRR